MTKEDLDFINKETKKDFVNCKLSISSKTIEDNKKVDEIIKKFSPVDGWLSLQSTSANRVQNSSFETKGEHILAGEFVNNQNQSLSVRFTGDDWLVITTMEDDSGEEVIKTSSKQLSKLGESVFLNYTVYFKTDLTVGCRPYLSAFTGFSEGK